jgi:hypothetical protein
MIMSTCRKCGKEVESPETVCPACAAADEPAPDPRAPSSSGDTQPKLTPGQRALAGAKVGALLGAVYGGIYGLIIAVILIVFATGENTQTAVQIVIVYAAIGALLLAPLGALLRLVFPGKRKKAAPTGDASAKADTKIDHP